MNENKDYYAILGVTPLADDVVIRAKYKALAQRYHPDKYQATGKNTTLKMMEINEAYSILSNPDKRIDYDARRRQNPNHSNRGKDENKSKQPAQNKNFTEPAKNNLFWEIFGILKKLPFRVSFLFLYLILHLINAVIDASKY